MIITVIVHKGFGLEVYFEYPKKVRELNNDYPSAPNEIEIEKEILSDYQLKIAIFYNILIRNVRKLGA